MKCNFTLYLTVIAVCFSINSAFSQHHVGVIGGVNLPFVNFTDFVIDARYNSGIMPSTYAGISYRYQNHKNIGLQVDFAYAEKGWSQVIGENVNKITNSITYIELPAYFRWTLLGERKFNVSINAGVYTAYAISTAIQQNNEQQVEESVATYNINTDNRADFGLCFSLGVSYLFNFGYLQIEGGMKSGFGNILPVSEIKKENPVVSTNQVPTILFSYIIPLAKLKK